MKLKALFESKDKKPNPMAKALSDPKFKPKTEIDKKKEAKKGYQKHKGKVEEAGYQGEVEPTHHDFKNVNLDSIKKIIADRNLKVDAEEVDGAIRVHTYDADRKSVAKSLGINESELYINGMKTIEDVIDMIKDTVDRGESDDANDYLEQFKQYLHSRGITAESVDPPRYDMDAKRELAQEIYNNSEYYQSEYEDWEAFMNSDDFEEENDRLRSKFGESKIKPYISMYTDDETGKMWYDVLDSDEKSAFKTKDKKAAMGFFNKNFDALRKGFDSMKDENVSAIAKAINEAVGSTWDTKNYSSIFGDQDSKLKQFVKNVNPFKSDDYKKLQMAKQAERDNPNWRGEPGDQAGDTLPNGRRKFYRNVNGQKQRVDIYKDIYPDESVAEFDGPDETSSTQDTTPQKGPDDSRLQTNVSLQQVANLFPGVADKQVFLQSLLRLKQGQKISMQHAYTLADAFKELLAKDPQDTQRTMMQLKKINTAESFSSLDKTLAKTYTSDDAPGYPHQNKTMHQGKTPEQALKDERTENFDELDRVKKLAGLLNSEKE